MERRGLARVSGWFRGLREDMTRNYDLYLMVIPGVLF